MNASIPTREGAAVDPVRSVVIQGRVKVGGFFFFFFGTMLTGKAYKSP